MFEAASAEMGRVIDELEIPVERGALVRCFRLLDRLSAKLAAAVAAFDEAEVWRDDGATSMTAWLRQHTGQSGRDARRWARVSRRLAGLPVTARAYGDGTLSGGQVQAIVANLNDDTAPLFAEAEGDLVAKLARLNVKDVGSVMQGWAAAAKDHLQPDPADGEPDDAAGPARRLHLSETLDGRGELSGSLDPGGPGPGRDGLAAGRLPGCRGRAGAQPGPSAGRRAARHLPVLPGQPDRVLRGTPPAPPERHRRLRRPDRRAALPALLGARPPRQGG